MEAYIRETSGDKNIEEAERKMVNDFVNEGEVNNVFSMYKDSLFYLFKFYSS